MLWLQTTFPCIRPLWLLTCVGFKASSHTVWNAARFILFLLFFPPFAHQLMRRACLQGTCRLRGSLQSSLNLQKIAWSVVCELKIPCKQAQRKLACSLLSNAANANFSLLCINHPTTLSHHPSVPFLYFWSAIELAIEVVLVFNSSAILLGSSWNSYIKSNLVSDIHTSPKPSWTWSLK